MRIMGFGKKWDKLKQPEFTTFRFPRRDKDWQVGEQVQIIVKPRSKGGGTKVGDAEITRKDRRQFGHIVPEDCSARSELEAKEDGFENRQAMIDWLWRTYKYRIFDEPMNKLTLKWVDGTPVKEG